MDDRGHFRMFPTAILAESASVFSGKTERKTERVSKDVRPTRGDPIPTDPWKAQPQIQMIYIYSIIIIHAVIIVCSFAECNTFELILKDNYVSYYCVLFVIIIFLMFLVQQRFNSETPSLHRSESLRISELLASHLLQLDAVPLTGANGGSFPQWIPRNPKKSQGFLQINWG